MKISPLIPTKIDNHAPAGAAPAGKTSDFQALLESRLHAPFEVASPDGIESVAPLPPEGMAAMRVEGLTLTESVLTTMEQYAEALANTDLKISALEPYVSALEEETLAMLEIRGHLTSEDSLATLLDKVATASYLETLKYRRGDYSA